MKIKYLNSNIGKKIVAFTLVGTLTAPSLAASANMDMSNTQDTLSQVNSVDVIAVDEKQSGMNEAKQYAYFLTSHKETIKELNAVNSSYWWPIGSEETVKDGDDLFAKTDPYPTNVTSPYGYRIHPISGATQFHTGVDIAGSAGNGIVNIIAAKDGVVVYPSVDESNNGGYGNYVIIEHSDGNFTLYAHLHPNSITVTAGDNVKQGQVIGKMGSSGYSTGTHLHFEVRVGENDSTATVNPLDYIFLDNPRAVSMDNGLATYFNDCKVQDANYIVEYCSNRTSATDEDIMLEYNSQKNKVK